jgi:alcohol dehydrogenase
MLQQGACLAGAAIENSMLGAAHALANPLTSRFDVPHGQAVGMMLPHVVRFNAPACNDLYGELVSLLDDATPMRDSAEAGELLARRCTQVAEELGLVLELTALGVASEAIASLAEDAASQWTGTFNPRPMTPEDAAELYRRAL